MNRLIGPGRRSWRNKQRLKRLPRKLPIISSKAKWPWWLTNCFGKKPHSSITAVLLNYLLTKLVFWQRILLKIRHCYPLICAGKVSPTLMEITWQECSCPITLLESLNLRAICWVQGLPVSLERLWSKIGPLNFWILKATSLLWMDKKCGELLKCSSSFLRTPPSCLWTWLTTNWTSSVAKSSERSLRITTPWLTSTTLRIISLIVILSRSKSCWREIRTYLMPKGSRNGGSESEWEEKMSSPKNRIFKSSLPSKTREWKRKPERSGRLNCLINGRNSCWNRRLKSNRSSSNWQKLPFLGALREKRRRARRRSDDITFLITVDSNFIRVCFEI